MYPINDYIGEVQLKSIRAIIYQQISEETLHWPCSVVFVQIMLSWVQMTLGLFMLFAGC